MLADQADHVLGVDTHRDSHSAAILATDTAVVQGRITVAANERGYRRLLRFACESAPGRRAWAVEGTGSYGAGLTVFLQREGELVLEVDRPRRPARRDRAKSDELDAIRAAREALTREHLARPRQRGEREALRVLLATRDSAVRSKRAAITLMKGLLVSAAPSPARRAALSAHKRAARALCAAAHQPHTRLRAARHHDRDTRERTTSARACRGSTRARSGDQADRRSPGALSARGDGRRRDRRSTDPLRLLPPRPHQIGSRLRTARRRRADPGLLRQTVRHRLNRSGDRQLNRALHLIVLCACETTLHTRLRRAATSKNATPARSTAASSATPPATSTGYSNTHRRISNSELDKHRCTGV